VDEMTGQVVRQLISVLKCTSCGCSYRETDVNILSRKDNAWLVNVQCSFCGSLNLVAAVVERLGHEPAATDLTPDECARFANAPAINANDVLNIHYFLEEFDGDFKRLLQH